MKRLGLALALLWAGPSLAQESGHAGHHMPAGAEPADPHAHHKMPAAPKPAPDPHAGHTMPAAAEPAPDPHAGHQPDAAPDAPPASVPPEALAGPQHAADMLFPGGRMDRARRVMAHEMGEMATQMVLLDRLEWQAGKGADRLLWDANIWTGGDIDKLWFKSEGEIAQSGQVEEAELQALWSHAIDPWFEVQAGVRQDLRRGADRTHLALGLQGLLPYFIELDAAAFLSHKGELTARIEAEHDLRVTQRLIAQPRAELALSAQAIDELGLGSGATSVALGMRLRYELRREIAPYLGAEWQRDLGQTARFTRSAGEHASRTVLLAGIRAWF